MKTRLKNMHRSAGELFGVLVLLLSMTGVSYAEEAEAETKAEEAEVAKVLDEDTQDENVVVVTAQFRKQSIKDVPIAISAYDADAMKLADMEDLWDVLDMTPGFAGVGTGGSWLNTISVRGIRTNDFGVGGDTSVGVFKDGVYQGRTGAAVTNFFDMERAEALRGPQGFLYGRNTISGAINTVTNKPNQDNVEAYGDITIGARNLHEVSGMVNVPLNEEWAIRFAGYDVSEDGYLTNVATPDGRKLGEYRSRSGRLSVGYDDGEVVANIIAEYERREGDGVVYRSTDVNDVLTDLGFEETDSPYKVNTDFPGHDEATIRTVTALVDVDLGDYIFSSVTGYRSHNWDYSEDDDGSSNAFYHWLQRQSVDNYSQDFRLASNTDGALTWLIGVSGYVEEITARLGSQSDEDTVCMAYYGIPCTWISERQPEGLLELADIDGTYSGYAISANATYAVSDKLEIDAGIRYSYDEKDFGLGVRPVTSELGPFLNFGYFTNEMVYDKKSWDDLTPRIAARYALTDDLTLWGSVTRGYKAGGFSSFGLQLPTPEELGVPPCAWGIYCVLNADYSTPEGTKPQSFEPESVLSYETGLKGDLLDDSVTFDVNVFYYKYKDMQIKYWDTDLFNVVVENVGRVKGYGLEGMIKVQATDYLSIQVGGSFMETKVNEIPLIICDCEGNRLSQQPKTVFTGLITYNEPVENGAIFAAADFRYQSQFYGGLDNDEFNSYGSRVRASARVGYNSDAGWGISVYVDNLFNDDFYGGGTNGSYPFPQLLFDVARPRAVGINFTYSLTE